MGVPRQASSQARPASATRKWGCGGRVNYQRLSESDVEKDGQTAYLTAPSAEDDFCPKGAAAAAGVVTDHQLCGRTLKNCELSRRRWWDRPLPALPLTLSIPQCAYVIPN